MITSPILPVSPSVPKVAKASAGLTPSNTEQSFGSALEAASQSASDKTSSDVSVVEKNDLNQSSSQSDVNASDNKTVASQASQHSDDEVQASTTEGALDQTSSVNNADDEEDSSSTKTEPKSDDISLDQEDGKTLQADGQHLAVEASVPPQPLQQELQAEQPLGQTDVDQSDDEIAVANIDSAEASEMNGSEASSLTLDTDSGVSSEGVESAANGDLTIENSVATAADSSISIEDADVLSSGEETSAISEGSEKETQVFNEAAGETASALLDDTNIVNSPDSSQVEGALKTSPSLDADVLTDGGSQNTVQENTQTVVEAAQAIEARPVDLSAQGNVEVEADPEVEVKANENLRWVMEQMLKKTDQANGYNALNQSAQDDAQSAETEFLNSLVDGELSLDSDKLELPEDISDMLGGKKTLDQLMANLGSQLQETPAQTQAQTTINAVQTNLGGVRSDTAAAQLTMQSMPNTPTFAAEMATKVSWASKEGFKTAQIHLDPPELGSLTVKISVDHESNAHVTFVASSAQAKDALEGQMQRLREMLQQQGVELDSVDVEVSQGNDQAFGSGQFAGDAEQNGSASGIGIGDDLLESDELDNVGYVTPEKQGIDYYA